MAPRAIITGAAGLIGRYLLKTAPRWAPDWDVGGLAHADLDLTDSVTVGRTWQSIKPSAIIHCAAVSRTKDCEQDPEKARRVNVDATAHLARLSEQIPFIFFSSGEVFDGRKGWYSEVDTPNPIHVYAQTNLEAE